MKKLFTLLLLSTSLSVFAMGDDKVNQDGQSNTNNGGTQAVQYCNMPKEIKIVQKQCAKAKIIVKDRIVYKIRTVKAKAKTKVVVKEKIVVKEKPVYKKNMLKLLGGYGPTGVDVYRNGNSAIAEERKGLVIGLGYSRMLNESFSVGGDVLSNGTYLLEGGFHF